MLGGLHDSRSRAFCGLLATSAGHEKASVRRFFFIRWTESPTTLSPTGRERENREGRRWKTAFTRRSITLVRHSSSPPNHLTHRLPESGPLQRPFLLREGRGPQRVQGGHRVPLAAGGKGRAPQRKALGALPASGRETVNGFRGGAAQAFAGKRKTAARPESVSGKQRQTGREWACLLINNF